MCVAMFVSASVCKSVDIPWPVYLDVDTSSPGSFHVANGNPNGSPSEVSTATNKKIASFKTNGSAAMMQANLMLVFALDLLAHKLWLACL